MFPTCSFQPLWRKVNPQEFLFRLIISYSFDPKNSSSLLSIVHGDPQDSTEGVFTHCQGRPGRRKTSMTSHSTDFG
ncbi:Hypothetical protein FKW44_003721 [Caligus rogercresseyi]|uniref:Uncharacterized protein n=1 Tax=Caligus rogercresseyi TaxID=217165 RepID=A0A7T8KM08_CALRO|nr:Hypothetical protein FKW44_024453 [Caligus rogercresseyi]QQP58410.1 Hypothetical protein FKW44_003721 [Caligus rogercresseyi]